MTFRKQGRPTYYVWPTLPGFGRVGPWSTGTREKKRADAIEHFLRELAVDRPALVAGLVARRYSLPTLWAAKLAKRLDTMATDLTDPLLSEVVRDFRPSVASDRRYQAGYDHLLRLAPPNARLSYIAQPRDRENPSAPCGPSHLNAMIATMLDEGMRPNSITRSLYMGVSRLLAGVVGKEARDRVLSDVPMPREDDSRDVHLTPDELARLLSECADNLYPIVAFAVLSGWDLGPIARMTPRDFDPSEGTMIVRDTKNASRFKREQLSDAASGLILAQMQGRPTDAPLWDLGYKGIYNSLTVARGKAGLPWLRFKDLRHVAATMAAEAGMNARELQDFLRHKTGRMALRYLSSLPNQRRDRLNTQAERLGLAHPHLRAKGGSA